MCHIHTQYKLGLVVKDSTLDGAGKGLFAARKFKKHENIVQYTGKVTDQSKADQDSEYRLEALTRGKDGERREIDGKDPTNSSVARYANTKTRKVGNNSAFTSRGKKGQVFPFLKASRAIKKGSEIFADYGRLYRGDIAKAMRMKKKNVETKSSEKKT